MMAVDARKCRDRDQQEEVGRMVRRLMESRGGPPGFPVFAFS